MMEVIDRALRMHGVSVWMLPLRACCLVAHRHGDMGMLNPDRREPRDGVYTDGDLILRMSAWYTARYGKRLTVDFISGHVALLIRRESWVARVPRIWGGADIFISSTERTMHLPGPWITAKPARVNVLDQIVDLPDGLRSSLKAIELKQLLETYVLARNALCALDAIAQRVPPVKEVLDLNAAVHHMTGSSPHYGQVRWSALQGLEKTLNAGFPS